jgi:maltose alpha-D-glucosyltransferase/alpha-amylase
MQWDDGPNAGFSTAEASRLYLPVDPSPDRPTVAAQEADPASTLHLVRALTAVRRATPALRTGATTRVINEGYPFAYVRGESHLVVVNPRREPAALVAAGAAGATALLASGVSPAAGGLVVAGFGYGILARLTEGRPAPD